MSKDQNENPNAKANLSVVEGCKVKRVNENYDLVECVGAEGLLCLYAFTFENRCLCRHPRRKSLVEKAERQNRAEY